MLRSLPCKGGVPPLTEAERAALLVKLPPEWQIEDGHHLIYTYTFRNFKGALAFTNAIGEVAEQENRNPISPAFM